MHTEYLDDPMKLCEGSRFERKLINVAAANEINKKKAFTVASYNVLSQHLLERHTENYVNCHKDVLGWEYRSGRIIEEILYFMPDIVCLQEVHHSHYKTCFMAKLNKHGYYGKYRRRPGVDSNDGCATFFKVKKFKLQEVRSLAYDEMDEEVDGRNNIALAVVLTMRSNKKHICVANTHLLYNPKRGDIKLTQLAILLAKVDAMQRKYSSSTKHHSKGAKHSHGRRTHQTHSCGVLICGDFNLVPFSTLHNFLSHGGIDTSSLICSQLSGILPPLAYGGRPLMSTKFLPSSINSNCQFATKQDPPSGCQDDDAAEQPSGGSVDQSHSLTNTLGAVSIESQDQKALYQNPCAPQNTSIDMANLPGNSYNGTAHTTPPHILTHGLNLTSAYPHLVLLHTHHASFVDMQVTQSTSNEAPKTFDYIFYGVKEKQTSIKNGVNVSEVSKEGSLKLLSYLQLPFTSSRLQALPNRVNGSDHLFLMAQFLLK